MYKPLYCPILYLLLWGSDRLLVAPSELTSRVSPINTLFYVSPRTAKKRIWIARPYFLLEINFRSALLQAEKRGVDVRIVTVSPRDDKQPVYHAVQGRYGDLLSTGIEVYEYQPSMMHAKVILIDNRWVVLGSANFDPPPALAHLSRFLEHV